MDGDRAHLQPPFEVVLPEIRVRVNEGKSIARILDPSKAPVRFTVPWGFGGVVRLERAQVDGNAWLIVPGASAGLPINRDESRQTDRLSWRGLWDDQIVEIELRRDPEGKWVAIAEGSEWGEFTNGTVQT